MQDVNRPPVRDRLLRGDAVRVTDAVEVELVDAQGRVESAKAGYDQALADRAAALRRWVDAGGSMYRAGQVTGMSAGAVRNALGLRA